MGLPWENAAAQPSAKPWEVAAQGPAAANIAAGASADGQAAPAPPPEKDWVSKLSDAVDRAASKTIPGMGVAKSLGETDAGQIIKRGAGKIFDYAGGYARTPLAALAGLVKPGPNPVSMQDVINTVNPLSQAPGVGDYAERFGMPNPVGTIPGTDRKISLKDAVNGVGNTVVNPFMFGGAGEAGEAAYDSAFKKIDERLLEQNKTPVSKIARENGAPVGTTSTLKKAIQKIGDTAKQDRDEGYAQENPSGDTAENAPTPPTPRAEAVLDKMRKNPGLDAQTEALEKHLEGYKNEGNVPLNDLSDWKSELANSLPESFYTKTANGQRALSPVAQRYVSELAADFRQGIVDRGDAAKPGLGERIAKANDTMASTISSEKPLNMQIRRGNTTNLATPIDAILSGHPQILALKKSADLAKATAFRTGLGRALMETQKVLPNLNPWAQGD